MYEKAAGILVVLEGYVTYITGKNLFAPADPDPSAPVFPFWHAEHQFDVYYLKKNVSSAA